MLEKNERCIVTGSHSASSKAIYDPQSTTESQQRQNASEIISEEYKNIRWGKQNLREVSKKIQEPYESIVFWKKNVFMLPTGAAAKKYITGTTKLMNGWTNNSPLKDIAFKAIHNIPSLLLQKSSKTSKAKDHLKALERRIDLWSKGKIDELLFEGETIQSRLHNINTPKSIGELSKKFALLMEKGNVNGSLKLLTSNISNGILPLDVKTLSLLKQKHSASSRLNGEVLLRGEKPSVHPVVFEDIDENMVKEAALKTKGDSGPSGLDADGWRKILVSKSYGTINVDLRRAFANVIK